LLVIEAGTYPEASAAVQEEIPQIIDSIRFQLPEPPANVPCRPIVLRAWMRDQAS
jgi:hypothetical protein